MADTVRTKAQLIALWADNDTGDITAGDGRDFLSTFFGFRGLGIPTPQNDRVDTAGIGQFFDQGNWWFNTVVETLWYCIEGPPGLADWRRVMFAGDAAGGVLTGTYPNPTLAAPGLTVNTKGSATRSPTVSIDADGRVTALTDNAIAGGGGTVTSVAITGPSIVTWTGSPITVAGTFTGALNTQLANRFLASATTGGAAVPTFREIDGEDIDMRVKGDLLTFDTALDVLAVGSDGQVLTADSLAGPGIKWATPTTGTVTSVAITGPSIITWSGSPITGAGTFTGTLANQSANLVLAGPASGGAAAPTFRQIVAADVANQTANTFLSGPTSGGAAAPTFRQIVAADVGLTTKGDVLTFSTVLARLGVGTDGQVLSADSTQATGLKWVNAATGSVTSVAITGPSIISWAGSPIVGAGTFTGTLANQSANLVLAGPTSGAAATPTFRAIDPADLPATVATTVGATLTGVTGTPRWFKFTLPYTIWPGSSGQSNITLCVLPAKAVVHATAVEGGMCFQTAQYTAVGLALATINVGVTSTAFSDFIAGYNVRQSPNPGAAIRSAGSDTTLYNASMSATQNVTAQLNLSGATQNNLLTGSVDVFLLISSLG